MMKRSILVLVAALSCMGASSCPTPPPQPTPPAPTLIDLIPTRADGSLIDGAIVDVMGTRQTCCYNGVTQWLFAQDVTSLDIAFSADGFKTRTLQGVPISDLVGHHNPYVLEPAHFDPTTLTLDDLSRIRGAMWTSRLNLPYGPRPGRDSNIVPFVFYDLYSTQDRERMVAHYQGEQHYVNTVTGPVTGNDCYHGLYPCRKGIPTQAEWDAYLDTLEEQWDRQLRPVYFAHPDGIDDPTDMAALDALYRQPRAQRLIRIVVYTGWEPVTYQWPNELWVKWVKHGAEVFPDALRLIHTVSDIDAPTGGDDDRRFPEGQGNALSWRNVAPYLHGWLVQVGGYVAGDSPVPTEEFKRNFCGLFQGGGSYLDRFGNGYAGWPTFSAWGPEKRLKVYAAEYASFGDFWQDWPERYAIELGNLAIACGADGYLDGGSVDVP